MLEIGFGYTDQAEVTMSMHRRFRDEAKAAGLLAGDKTAHIRIRTTQALLDAAKRQTGISSTRKLVETGLATLALDPVYRYMIENSGVLGKDHTLDV